MRTLNTGQMILLTLLGGAEVTVIIWSVSNDLLTLLGGAEVTVIIWSVSVCLFTHIQYMNIGTSKELPVDFKSQRLTKIKSFSKMFL